MRTNCNFWLSIIIKTKNTIISKVSIILHVMLFLIQCLIKFVNRVGINLKSMCFLHLLTKFVFLIITFFFFFYIIHLYSKHKYISYKKYYKKILIKELNFNLSIKHLKYILIFQPSNDIIME